MSSKYETTVTKRDGQWRACTTIALEGTQRELDITTSKDSRGNITARATVHRIEGAYRSHTFGFGSGRGDFSRLVLTPPCRRVTERTVVEAHQKALESVEALLAAVEDHYVQQALLNGLLAAHANAPAPGAASALPA
ncbi:MAG: hypothetical protein ACLGJD_10905 [Gammaproteobacteria bacterium]|uniref:hypothetical protein n=1 Tax=uncultured Pseudacidovorax sp. TaxID=679313 RepID=UPI0025E98BFB|nr:hypothetical protein [uncultured Pseudacidovorax sp.]